MVAVKAGDVAGILRKPDPRIAVFLVYGPDAGLVSERAKALAEARVDDAADPFQLIRLDGDVIAGDPARLVDEAGTIGLFGNRRAIWVRASSRNIAPAVEPLLQTKLQDTTVVIEGGDLAKNAPLRVLCERAQNVLALPCYSDTGRDLGDLVDGMLKEAGLTIDRDARAVLLGSLGGDRLATRGELAKLILYAHGRREITVADIDAVLSDVSSLAMDAVVDAAFAGDLAGLDAGFRRLAAEGTAASTVLGSALRHALALLPARLDMEAGKPQGVVVEAWRGLHFRRKPLIEKHLQRWTGDTLKRAVALLQAGLLETRRVSNLDDTLAAKVLLDIGRAAANRPSR
ncbi:MAG TPA: DNA polymerase III subunit delta [Microvirga sp.]|jgi:DNA polymerase-3 subunit delta|nr:DNA polymerase III subunit delta [Microvirga sp.]